MRGGVPMLEWCSPHWGELEGAFVHYQLSIIHYPLSIIHALTQEAVNLLSELIAIPSVSRDETAAADHLFAFLSAQGLLPQREGNYIWCIAEIFDVSRRTLLLNAHIDTVKPVSGWTRDPFLPELADGKLYGLGSNDCGGGLVSLLQTFRLLQGVGDARCPYNLVYLASAEEEVSGKQGIESVLPLLPKIDVAIVGEPTKLQPAIAEKGLMVLDATAHGRSGHAARNEGINAIYEAIDDIQWFRTHRFERVSDLLGPVKTTVTIIEAGTQHNVVPDTCKFTVDVRSNECYSNSELLEFIKSHVKSNITARSTRLNSSMIPAGHPLVVRCKELGKTPFGSPTLSDQALMPWPSLKIGPGDSARSHTADEYIRIDEISAAIDFYYRLLGTI